MAALEHELGWSVFMTPEGQRYGEPNYYPGWEFLADYGCGFEIVHILDDSGYAHVIMAESSPSVDQRDARRSCGPSVRRRNKSQPSDPGRHGEGKPAHLAVFVPMKANRLEVLAR